LTSFVATAYKAATSLSSNTLWSRMVTSLPSTCDKVTAPCVGGFFSAVCMAALNFRDFLTIGVGRQGLLGFF
jgi:hypothetical protein